MRIIIVILLSLLLTNPVYAQEADVKPNIIIAQINGLVCDFCAIALEKVFGKRDDVTSIAVNLDTKLVTIALVDNANIDDETVTRLINDAGYNVVEIRR